MAKHGMLFERDSMIPNAQIRGFICATDVDGGQPIVLGGKHATEKNCFVGTAFTTGAGSVHIAYNPARMYQVDEDGQVRPSRVVDKRYHYNIANIAHTCFKPEVGMYFGLTMANVDGTTAPTVGKFLEPKNDAKTYSIVDTQTADVASFKVIEIDSIDVPTGDYTDGAEAVYVVQCVAN